MDYLSESVHLKVNLMVFFSMKEIKNFPSYLSVTQLNYIEESFFKDTATNGSFKNKLNVKYLRKILKSQTFA